MIPNCFAPKDGTRYPLCMLVTSDGDITVNLWWFRIRGFCVDNSLGAFLSTSMFVVFYGSKRIIYICE